MNRAPKPYLALEKLIAALLTDPDALYFGGSVLNGRVNFRVGCSIREYGAIIGYEGSHLRAIQLIAELMGRQQGSQWVVKPEEPEGVRQEKFPKTPPPPEHDTEMDTLLLESVLSACGIGKVFLEVSGDVESGFVFKISPFDQAAHHALTEAHPALYSANQRETKPLSLEAALGCLFRAVGRRQGVSYRITIA
jgi:predicted RNA-binding protein YlqC (UPF0109 family)